MMMLYHLQQGSTSLIFNQHEDTLTIPHWGKRIQSDLTNDDVVAQAFRAAVEPPLFHGGLDVAPKNLILRENARGHMGHPAARGHRSGKSVSNYFVLKDVTKMTAEETIIVHFEDAIAGLVIELKYRLLPSEVLKVDASITNTAQGNYFLEHLLTWLPLPAQADQLLDFYGRWAKERQPQRRSIPFGLTTREGHEGRSGHDYTIAQIALNQATGFMTGEAWSVGVAWSGNNIHHVEKLVNGNIALGAGEYLLPGEIILATDKTYTSPTIVASYSPHGLDGLSHNHYSWIRSRSIHPTKARPRPLTLNLWEAIYFEQDENTIRSIVDTAAEIGVERIVLDDGWFGGRRDDTAGLGDWVVSKEVWPNGLGEIIEFINQKGMEFGLWFEGEMVQSDSNLFRAHPEWIMQEQGRWPVAGRHQQVLDLTQEGAYNHVLSQVDAILSEYNIAYIKWDHNRPMTDPISNGHAVVQVQTKALYRLFDELKHRHPGLEIESCSSGGGRIDFGMLEHVDRFWTSDQNDALERQHIQRWTSLVIPPEMLGTHVGPTRGHQTHRVTDITFRVLNALFGHAGIEWNIAEATDREKNVLKAFASFYKQHRELIHSGRMVRSDIVTGNAFLYGTVSEDQTQALFTYMQLETHDTCAPQPIQLQGLNPSELYHVEVVQDLSATDFDQKKPLKWWPHVTLPGDMLGNIGIQLPVLRPQTGVLLTVSRVSTRS